MISFRSDTVIPEQVASWISFARGVVAVEVVAFHAYQLMYLERVPDQSYSTGIRLLFSSLQAFSSHGAAAVMIFFVLSGYLVGGPAIVRAHQGRLNALDYFSARASRLYIVLVPALIISWCLYMSARQSTGWTSFVVSHQDLYDRARIVSAPVGVSGAICNGLFLQTIICSEFAANLPLWSLSNEFWYYILIFSLLSTIRKPIFALIVISIFAMFVAAERFDQDHVHRGLRFFFYFGIWGIGAAVYAFTMPVKLWAALLLGTAGLIYAAMSCGIVPQWAMAELLVAICSAAALIIVTHWELPLPFWLGFGKNLAKCSFSLYAIHYPVLLSLHVIVGGRYEFTVASFLLNLIFMMVGLLAGFAFYLIFERYTSWLRDATRRIWSSWQKSTHAHRSPNS